MTTKNFIDFPAKYLKAALFIAAKKDIRYYLNGVSVEVGEDETRIVATDGKALVVFRVKHGGEPAEFIIPRDAAEQLVKGSAKADPKVYCHYARNDELGVYELDLALTGNTSIRLKCRSIAGKYCDWRRVVPATTDGEVQQFDPVLLGAFSKVANLVGEQHVFISHNKGPNRAGPSLVHVGNPDVIGLLASYTFKNIPEDVDKTPEWAKQPLTAFVGPLEEEEAIA